MIKTVLLTGGGGFIGSHIIDLLLEKKYKIVILERSVSSITRIKKHLSKLKVYYTESNTLEEVFTENKIDCVIHLAAKYLKQHTTTNDVEEIVDINIKFPSLLIEYCRLYNVKHFINTGTFFEYQFSDRPLKEADQKEAYNLYAASKSAFTEILKYYAKSSGIKIANFYLFSPFGDRDNEKLMAFLIKGFFSQEQIDFSGGAQSWNFTYVKDIANAYLCALEGMDKLKGFEEFNVGYDKVVSIKEIVKKLEKISNKKLHINWGAKPYIDNEIFMVNCDNSKLTKVLKWKPEYNIDQGLERTYSYFAELYKEQK